MRDLYRLNEMAEVLASVRDPQKIEEFLLKVLTPAEIRGISSRWEILKLLEDGTPQRKIASLLGVSLCKITRGSRELKDEKSALWYMLKRYRNKRKP